MTGKQRSFYAHASIPFALAGQTFFTRLTAISQAHSTFFYYSRTIKNEEEFRGPLIIPKPSGPHAAIIHCTNNGASM